MAQFFGQVYSNVDTSSKVLAYASDNVLFDKLVTLDSALTADLEVGSVVDASGALATSTDDLSVVLSPAFAGQTYIRVARAPHVMLIASELVFDSSLTKEAVVSALESAGYVFSDFSTVALRTT